MVSKPRKREGDQLLLRFEDGSDLRERLNAMAKKNYRSLSMEIIFRLEQSFASEDRPTAGIGHEERIAALERAVLSAAFDLGPRIEALEGEAERLKRQK